MYSVLYVLGQLDLLAPVMFYLLISGLCVIHLIKLTPVFTLQIKLHALVLHFGRERVGKSRMYFTKQSIGFCTKLCLLVIPYTFYDGAP